MNNTTQRDPSPRNSDVPPAPLLTPILLSESEAAAMFGVSKRTFLALRSAEWMPLPIPLGPRLLKWSADELRAAIANMPRQAKHDQPAGLLRAKIARMKTTGVPA